MVKTKVKSAGASDTGRVRQNNEDAWHIDSERGIYLVVDGIGGQAAGEKAAEIAVECVRARLERQTGPPEQRVREAIAIANAEILRQARAHPEWNGMACVLTLALLDNGSAIIGHVGDSRLYEIRGGAIRKITHDHSPVGEMEDAGELSEAEAMRHPRRNEVYRDVGSEEHAPADPGFIEITRIPFNGDTALLLCSDGLSDLVPSAGIREAVERNAGNPEAAAKELIEAANRAGGKDNVTVVIAEGEQFAAPAVAYHLAPRSPFRFVVAALAAAAIMAGAIFGILWQRAHTPQPVAPAPRILAVGGGPNYDFPTISAAMTAARPGDTVAVEGGQYHEQVVLKTGVVLRTRLPGMGVLYGPAIGEGPAVIANGVSDARLSGFRVESTIGIMVSASDVEIDNVEIADARVGIEIRGLGHVALSANAIHDCATGVRIAGTPDAVSHVWLFHNSMQRNEHGLVATDNAMPLMVGNVFEKSPLELPADMDEKEVREKNFFVGQAHGLPPLRAGHGPAPQGKK